MTCKWVIRVRVQQGIFWEVWVGIVLPISSPGLPKNGGWLDDRWRAWHLCEVDVPIDCSRWTFFDPLVFRSSRFPSIGSYTRELSDWYQHLVLPVQRLLRRALTVPNVYRLHALKFVHAWHKGVLPELFNHFFQYASVHNYNTRYATKQNLHKFRVNTNIGKPMISFMANDLWQELPYKFKDLNQFAFSKSVKNYILSQQYQT